MTDFTAVKGAQSYAQEAADAMALTTKEAGKPVTCSKGCSACCSDPLLASRQEVEYALDMLSEEQRAEVAARTRRWVSIAVASGILREARPFVVFYRQCGLVCPLLKDNLCSVYERRPIPCRMHLAIGEPKLCSTPNSRLHQVFIMNPAQVTHAEAKIGDTENDHMGVWLAEILLNKKIKSATRRHMRPIGDALNIIEDVDG